MFRYNTGIWGQRISNNKIVSIAIKTHYVLQVFYILYSYRFILLKLQ